MSLRIFRIEAKPKPVLLGRFIQPAFTLQTAGIVKPLIRAGWKCSDKPALPF